MVHDKCMVWELLKFLILLANQTKLFKKKYSLTMLNIQYNVHILKHTYSICRPRPIGTAVKGSCLNHCCFCVSCGDKNCLCLNKQLNNRKPLWNKTKQQTLRLWRHHKQEQAKVALLILGHRGALRPKPRIFRPPPQKKIPQSVIALKYTRRELCMIYYPTLLRI